MFNINHKVFVYLAVVLIALSFFSLYQVIKTVTPSERAVYSTLCGDQVVLGHRVDPNGQLQVICKKRT